MRSIQILFLLLVAGIGPAGGSSAATETTEWLAVLLNGQRAGHMQLTRRVSADRVDNTEVFLLKVDRGGVPIVIRSEESYSETPDGRPLGFRALQQISGAEMEVEGTIDDNGTAHVITRSAGSVQTQKFAWQPDVLMAEGTRLLMASHGLEPGTEYGLRVFVPSSLQTVAARVRIEAAERVDLFGVEQQLVRVVERVNLGQTETDMVAWINTDLEVKKTRMSMMGLTFEAIACPEQCATAEIEPTEFFTSALVTSPRPLGEALRDQPLIYRIQAKEPNRTLHFAESAEQRVDSVAAGIYEVTVTRLAETPPRSPHATSDDRYLQATRWLQIDEPAIRRLARQVRAGESSDSLTMRKLESFVRDYVSDKNLSVGYASALEVARNRSGDCTEHALLLAALGRAAGIPTRVATGLAYVDRWLGAENVFVPHAWTQAFIDGRWHSYDAALRRFDSGHIALGHGDGDPWDFYDAVNSLGNLEIVAIQAQSQ